MLCSPFSPYPIAATRWWIQEIAAPADDYFYEGGYYYELADDQE